ncbi:ACT domain-containing protein ACR4-like isoform X1 [Prosopis cineraria]|uniref:ACT domain-containing protein ACR4-like isoform X1 n=2 Tax=Prosopis cineraria TaxID=364024 RepID=UPI002410307F|nr:ACT domain-containing protein ACR4-like isoform X1 [Prosopis cineraria]XP_054810443.1 ACT domain-containing protein ACR4-like isoform X1 [Prosopis cineraria]
MAFFSEADMSVSFSHYYDDYDNLFRRLNPPRVVIDNEACDNATVMMVDYANKHGILLEVVQILNDLNLIITKAYISSDGGWFMDVFNVTDQDGNKVTDEAVLNYIQKNLGPDSCCISPRRSVGVKQSMDYTTIEVLGADRPGLLSEVSAVLTHHKCNIVDAEVWTHNARAAAVMRVTDEETGSAITDPHRLSLIKELLSNLLASCDNKKGRAKTVVTDEVTHTDRRLHQMMCSDRDYERDPFDDDSDRRSRPNVNVVPCSEKDYSIVSIQCKDRPKLVFDAVCALTDMEYVVFHGSIDAQGPEAYQEYYIRHADGSPIKSDAERQRLVQCIEAAIERRVSEGVKLELCTGDRFGLLSDLTRILRENSLDVTRAQVSTKEGKAINTFYVRGASRCPIDSNSIESVRQIIGSSILKVKGTTPIPANSQNSRFLFGGIFKSRSFADLVKSYC